MMQDIASSPSDDSQTIPPSPATHDIPHFLALLDQLRQSIPPPTTSPTPQPPPQPTIDPALLLHALRPLQRSIHLQLDERRSALQRLYRRGVDGLNIERASWQYEKDWFVREIERQRQYVSTEKDIELVDEDEFRRKYPDAPTDPDQLHIARLQDELAERKRLLEQVNQLQRHKAQLTQSNTTQRTHLTTLTSTLTALYQSAAPLYTTFFPDATHQPYRPLPAQASELPAPLWRLFCVGWSYCGGLAGGDGAGAGVEVVVAGEAGREERGQGRDRGKEKDKVSVWTPHPLSVVLTVQAGPTSSVDLRFGFLPALHLVTVLPSASPSFPATADYSSLLHDLYPGDDGAILQTQHLQSLSPAVQQAVQSVSLDQAANGRPYVWCQRLAGLYPLLPDAFAKPAVDVSLADVVLMVRQRLEHRPIIEQQVQRYQLSPSSTASSLSSRVYSRQFVAGGGRALVVDVELPISYPVQPPRFALRSVVGGGAGVVDERKLRALESELNSADVGMDVLALSRLMDKLDQRWTECF